jgi:hypothetical protein
MTTTDNWLAVDRKGLGLILERRGKEFAAVELVSNAFDEDGVTRVGVTLTSEQGKPSAMLVVTDDAPDGFADLTHAFTMFAPSRKKGEAEQRGRFNLGEKLVLAIATEAVVASTRGAVSFNEDGTRTTSEQRRAAGSAFSGRLRMTRSEVDEALAVLHRVIVPEGITLTVNGDEVAHRTAVRTVKAELPTEIADEEGALRRSSRKATVRLFTPEPGEVAHVYEMGVPVVEHDGAWHVDVGQKVPLNMDRDNVTPAYLRKLRTIMVNAAADLLDEDEAAKPWVAEGLEDAAPEQVGTVLDKRFGEKRVVYDPTDPEANKRALDSGYAVIHGGSLSRKGWDAVRATGTTQAAGKVLPSGVDTASSGKPPLDEDELTDGMRRIVAYAEQIGLHLLKVKPTVAVESLFSARHAATFGRLSVRLTFNVGRLGHAWFDNPDPVAVDALLIHEFAHYWVSDHLSDAFHDRCCTLGAQLRSCPVTLD